MKIDLSPRLEKMIEEKVETGLYPAAADVVEEALELMAARDMKHRRLQEALDKGRRSYEAGEYLEVGSLEELGALFEA